MNTKQSLRRFAATAAIALLALTITGCVPWLVFARFTIGDVEGLTATFEGDVSVLYPLVLVETKFRDDIDRPTSSPGIFSGPQEVRVDQWLWDFGDDSTGSGQTVTHAYDDFGCYRVILTVVLSNGMQGTYQRQICFEGDNRPPVALPAGPGSGVVGSAIQLDGLDSYDPDDDVITYLWSIVSTPEGSQSEIDDPASPTPAFTPDVPGTYVFALVVNDGQLNSTTQQISITVASQEDPNRPPVAIAIGPEINYVNSTIVLDGSDSYDPDGNPITYMWSILARPAESTAVLDNPALATPMFYADLPGQYTFGLVVNDGQLDSEMAQVTISVFSYEEPLGPVAYAGEDMTVCQWQQVPLDGSGSYSPNEFPLYYHWDLDGPEGSTAEIDFPGSPTPTFVTNMPGEYIATLYVYEGGPTRGIPATRDVNAVSDTVTITAETPTWNMLTVYGTEFYMGPSAEEIEDEVTYPNELPHHPAFIWEYYISETEVTNCLFAHVLNYAHEQGYLESRQPIPYRNTGYTGGDVFFQDVWLLRLDDWSVLEEAYCDVAFDPEKNHFYVKQRDGHMMGPHPISQVSWYGAVTFCNWLTEMEGIYGKCYNLNDTDYFANYAEWPLYWNTGYRLPYEAEWEFAAAAYYPPAARYVGHWRYAFNNATLDTTWANYQQFNPLGLSNPPYTTPVRYFNGVNPNTNLAQSPHGCFDMSGNVSEWVQEWDYPYGMIPRNGSRDYNMWKLHRGGNWLDQHDTNLRTARRRTEYPDYCRPDIGFRIVQQLID